MKNIIYLVILFSFNSLFAQDSNIIVGEWNATDFWENKSKFIFSEDGYISMTINGEFVDGKNFIVKKGKNKGQKTELKYKIDYNKTPIELEIKGISVVNGKLEKTESVLGILKFLNNDEALLILTREAKEEFNEESKDRVIKLQRNN